MCYHCLPFMQCPLVANINARWSIKAILTICHPYGIYLLQLANNNNKGSKRFFGFFIIPDQRRLKYCRKEFEIEKILDRGKKG